MEQEGFKGKTLHSLEHNKATDHAGKKVVVVGACTSGTLILLNGVYPSDKSFELQPTTSALTMLITALV